LDASLIHLSARLFPWAAGGWRKATAVKLHVLLALRSNLPSWAAISKGAYPEVRMLDHLPVEPGCFYVVDRGYLDFARLHQLAERGGFFGVRGRRDLSFDVLESRAVDKTTGLRCDQTIRLINPHSRREYPEPLRRVRVRDLERKKTIVLLTNHFEIPAPSVADLYRRRWQIELFFKWMKQHLRIRGFFGTTPNAVQCQLWSAICTYLLVAILKKELKLRQSLHEILQILSLHPFEQHPVIELLAKIDAEENSDEQQNLFNISTI
jgi:IS4 transposase